MSYESWTRCVGGVLLDIAPAATATGSELYFTGRGVNGTIWWWRQTGNQWIDIGNSGVAGGKLTGTPR
jgi:hypothetical protein